MSKYLIEQQEYGRTNRVLDVQAFARDLAAAMGGTYVQPKKDDMGARERWASFELDGAEISVARGWRNTEATKITVSIAPVGCKLSYNDTPRGEEYALPSATVSAERPLAHLVKDITRRVVEPAKAPIAKRRQLAIDLAAKANSLVEAAAALRKAHGLDVKIEPGANFSGSFYRNGNGPYLSGRLYADGTVSVDRLGSLTAKQFERLMRALYTGKDAS